MLLIIKLCFLMLSIAGYLLFLTKKCQLKAEFAPALFCAWASNFLFVGGLLNMLPHAAWLLYMAGFVLLVLSCQSGLCLDKREKVLYAILSAALAYFFWIMNGSHFTSYDNFSHWATAVKDLLRENRMPNFEDGIIRFQSYPLGSSLFIYYICMFTSNAEHCMLWAQLWMLISFLFCLAAFLHKKNWYMQPFAILFSIWALSANNSIYELRVDTLLPLAGVAAFAVIYAYREMPGKAIYASMGLFILLINIKNSGVFFYLACLLFLAACLKQHIRMHKLPFLFASLSIPLFTIFLWKRHVALVFPQGLATKHSMSFENYGQVFAKKSPGDIALIGRNILSRFQSFGSVEVQVMLAITAMSVILMSVLYKSGQALRLLRMLAGLWGCLAAYTISVYAMYIFSMPLGEALHLASYDRYILSVLIFIFGIAVIFVTGCVTLQRIHIRYAAGLLASVLAAAAPAWQARMRIQALCQKPDFTHTKRHAMQELFQRDGITEGDSCFFYCNGTGDDARYLFYLSRYELWSDEIIVANPENFDEKITDIADCRYLVIWDSDGTISQYLKSHGLASYQGMEKIGIQLASPYDANGS